MFNMIDYSNKFGSLYRDNIINKSLICQNVSAVPYCIIPMDKKYNKEYVESNNMTVIYSDHSGGALVLFPSDIAWTWLTNKKKMQDVLQDVLTYLQQFNREFYINGNDIMYGDNKVLGSMSVGEGLYYEGIFFSFQSDVNLIKNVTLKEISKPPIGLAQFNIEPSDIITLIEELIVKYEIPEY